MRYIYKAQTIEYDIIVRNNSNKHLLLLHGWGGDRHSFDIISSAISNYNILSLSLPNICSYTLPYTMIDYTDIVSNILTLHNIQHIDVLCHSFGMRVATMLSSRVNIDRLICTGGAGLIIPTPIIKKIYTSHKRLKGIDVSSADYKSLQGNAKKTFVNIVNNDMTKYAEKITSKTLLYYGRYDKDTNAKMAKKYNKLIKNSELIFVDSDHWAYIKYAKHFERKVKEFLL